jgi:hypothetical protein
MKAIISGILALFCQLFIRGIVFAQIHQGFTQPLQFTEMKGIGEFFTNGQFYLGLQRAFGDMSSGPIVNGIPTNSNRDQAWYIRLGGNLDVYRFNSTQSIRFSIMHQLQANTLNDISFNPRMAIWEERVEMNNLFNTEIELSAGIFHRCKHNIDNLDGEINDKPNPLLAQSRVIIQSGISAALLTPFYSLSKDIALMAYFRPEFFLISSDYIFPENSTGASTFQNAKGSISASMVIKYQPDTWQIYMHPFAYTVLQDRSEPSWRCEIGYKPHAKSLFKIGILYESLGQEIARIKAERTSVYSIALSFSPQSLW